MTTRAFWLLALVTLGSGCDATPPTSPGTMPPDATTSRLQGAFAQEVVIDFVSPKTHAGPGPHPTVETSSYTFFSGGIRWFAGSSVEYRITGTAPTGANTAVVAGEETWDLLAPNVAFSRNDNTSQLNPCTGAPSTIEWVNIDGPGGTLGAASPCYDVRTKEIVGFSIFLDNSETWSTSGAPNAIDVANVATHEFGHAVGLGHVNAPRDGCLTMFKFTTDGEIQKRTPGLGDKLGMAVLYGNTDTTAGSCGS